MTLRWRLALLFALGTAVVIAIAGLLFLQQLTAGLNNSLTATLRARADAEVARLSLADPLPPLPQPPPSESRDTGQQGDQHGQNPVSDDITQVLAREGAVLATTDPAVRQPLADARQRRAAAHAPVRFTTTVEGEKYRMLAVPAHHGARLVLVVVGTASHLAEDATARTSTALWIAGPSAVVLAGLGAYALTGSALRPVERMRRRLADISEHDTAARLPVPGTRDEIATLASTMNAVLERLARALDRERGFVADAGHELRTPLTTLKAELELARRPGRSPQALVNAITAAEADTDRLIRLTEDLLVLAREDEGHAFLRTEPIAPADILTRGVHAASARAETRGVRLALRADPHIRVAADPDRLRQAVDNLLDNALRHSPDGAVIDVTLSTRHGSGGDVAVIEVRDHGPGFPPAFLPLAFERFRRADAARARASGGAGLGLAIVRSIAEAHGGSVAADNPEGGGARVRLELPLAPAPEQGPSRR
ncbi:ATP-binding protein [Streptomyces sp. NPDC007905]|uniref:sensor histidine kinase n=1 Tax=Streptomyces sp. NPDC007905 TaxID=3364788 RepID=UPI0036E22341